MSGVLPAWVILVYIYFYILENRIDFPIRVDKLPVLYGPMYLYS